MGDFLIKIGDIIGLIYHIVSAFTYYRDGNKVIIKLLLSHGGDPSKKNFSGVSVLDHVRKIKTHPNRDLFENYF